MLRNSSFKLARQLCVKASSQAIRTPVYASKVLPTLITRGFSQSFTAYKSPAKEVLEVLESEIKVEKQISESQAKPEGIDLFLETSGFKVVNSSGRNLAELVKETEDAIVHVYFDVAQITNIPEQVPTEGETQDAEEYDLDSEFGEDFANVNIVVEKKADKSAISIESLFKLDDGTMFIESITPFGDAALALSESAENETIRQLTYHGPPFSNLDESLQTSFEAYVRDLGLNETFAEFLVSYSEHKENTEYFTWLQSVTKFFS